MKSYRKDGMSVLVSSFIRNGLCRKYDCAEPFSEGFAVIGVRDEKKERWRCGYIEKRVHHHWATVRIGSPVFRRPSLAGVGMCEELIALKALDAGKQKRRSRKKSRAIR